MSPPDGKHFALRERQRSVIKQLTCFSPQMRMQIGIDEMTLLLDYIDNLEEIEYSAWEDRMGEDL